MLRRLLLAVPLLLLAAPLGAQPLPTLLFSDLTSGPNSGNSDNSQPGQTAGQDGAIVTVWGRNLGDTQGASTVTVNGQPARVYSWGRALAPANLYARLRMQMIVFQIPRSAPPGSAPLRVTVNGVVSNTLPFTVRPGSIRFVKTSGNDLSGTGSWASPWRTLDNTSGTGALEKLGPGDIVYVGDGVVHRDLAGDRAAIDLSAAGTPELPKAIVGYPGATASVGDSVLANAFSLWVSGYGPTRHWVIAKLHLSAAGDAADLRDGFRLIGNRITAPRGDGPTGAVAGQGNDLAVLGNELTNIGHPTTSKLYHPIYIQSAEACGGPRLPTERNREIAWNHLHDNLSYDGINLFRECGSSAYMTDHRVHDNYIENQTGVGIRIGDYVTGENWIYNNIVVHAGLGPDPPTEYAMHVPIYVHAGWPDTTTLIHVYNNTIYGGGFPGGQAYSYAMIGFSQAHPFVADIRNNIVVSTVPGVGYENPSLDPPPGGGRSNLWFGAGSAPAWDADPIVAAPLFVNAAAGDFRLSSGSPAIGRSYPSVPTASQPVPAMDFYSVPRLADGAADVGAIEYGIANNSDVPPTPGPLLFSVFPSPASAAIHVRLNQPGDASPVSVLDIRGRLIASARPTAATLTFASERFPPGVYLVRYRSQTTRVVVTR